MSRSSTSGQGRPKGAPNKATQDARRAIATFVDDNAGRLQGWLDQIASGVKDEDTGEYVVTPNPEKAFNLFQSVIEYHVPKLARTVVAGDPDNPLQLDANVTMEVPGLSDRFAKLFSK
jgi:hypothetical protein